jgi:hypothetical protein
MIMETGHLRRLEVRLKAAEATADECRRVDRLGSRKPSLAARSSHRWSRGPTPMNPITMQVTRGRVRLDAAGP